MKGIQLSVLLVLIGIATCSLTSLENQLEWISWKLKYNKSYRSQEDENVYKATWLKNKAFVEDHNRKEDTKFKVELNQFADQVCWIELTYFLRVL